jgi:hypothetical protein
MISDEALRSFFRKEFGDIARLEIRKLGSGVQGSGFLVEMDTGKGPVSYVVKGLFPEGLGHDYPSDRAAVFLLDLEEFGSLPRHVRAVDVLSEMQDGTIKSIGGGREYYLLMEQADGRDYFRDLSSISGKESLDAADIKKINALTSYLADLHSVKKESKTLYWRKLRDIIGHGECLMGVFDTYPEGTLGFEEMARIEKACIDWRARLKHRAHRLCRVHGDFHPGNIWFRDGTDFILLDRSRGPWGEPADDLTALAINYIFFSLVRHGQVRAACFEGLKLFIEGYCDATADREILEVAAPFFAFRAVVVANPVFYPDLEAAVRKKLFNFARNVLAAERFEVAKVNRYLEAG